MSMRSEYAANVQLTPTTKNPTWMDPAPIRTKRPLAHHFTILSIAQRHPRLFGWLNRKK